VSLILAHDVIPGTDWIRHDPSAWWAPLERGTRPRAKVVNKFLGHWTGGEAGTGDPDGNAGPLSEYDDDGRRVVSGMKARRRQDGALMRVGVHFVIGACDPAEMYAPCWQTADPGITATIHVGDRVIGSSSIGVELVSAGVPGKFDLRRRPVVRAPLLGKTREVLAFYPGQLRTWVRLANTLAAIRRSGIAIPQHVPAIGATRRFTRSEARRWAGGMEHLHVPGTTKIDGGGLLIGALREAGWDGVQP
jgi:hypothetical protein